MRIGIMTYWWTNDNYGQLLQCYALQKYLRNMGYDAFLIRYNHENDIKSLSLYEKILKAVNPIILYNFIYRKLSIRKNHLEQLKNNRGFNEFRQKYIVQSENFYKSFSALKQNPPVADVYIVGSDQVWNNWGFSLQRFFNPLHAYFLDFGGEKIKKIAYAASWGVNSLSASYTEEIAKLIKKFTYVSVREKSGIDLCQLCGYENADLVCDPVLLFSAEHYRRLYSENKINTINEKYLLIYKVGNHSEFNIQKIKEFADKKELKIKYVTANDVFDSYEKTFATIPEWLYLIDNAEYVVTNSFHASVFSLIFHKQFGVFVTGKSNDKYVRFDSLFELCKINSRYINNFDFSILDEKYENLDTIELSSPNGLLQELKKYEVE